MKLQISLSAIPLSIVKKMMRKTPSKIDHMYDEIFNRLGEGKSVDKYRIYIPLDSVNIKAHKVVPPQAIVDYLTSIKFSLNDYLLGTAIMPDGKRTVRLGKALSKKPELLKMFENDPQRKLVHGEKLWVVISRHPYDILGMSFDRGWSSCMNLKDGVNKHYLKGDLKHGTLVAYLIKDTDKNINAPISRIAIRPYYDKKSMRKTKKNIYLVPSSVYGTDSEKFELVVNKFCSEMNAHAPHGIYELKKDLYDDGEGSEIFHLSVASIKALSPDELTQVSRQGKLEPDIIDAMVEVGNSDLRFRLTNYHLSSMSEKSRMIIAQDKEQSRSHMIMSDRQKSLSAEVLRTLAKSENSNVLFKLATNTHSVEILNLLMNSEHDHVRRGVADSFVATDAILTKLADDNSMEVLETVAGAENTSLDVIKYILKRKVDTARLTKLVLRRTDLPADFVTRLIDENMNTPTILVAATDRRDLTAENIRKIYDKSIEVDNEIFSDLILENLCRLENTPFDIIEKIAKAAPQSAVRAILRREDLTPEIVDDLLFNSTTFDVIASVLKRSTVTEDQMKYILSYHDSDGAEMALESEHITLALAEHFVRKGVAVTVRNAARHCTIKSPLPLAIAKCSSDEKVLRNLVDYNDADLEDTTYMTLMNNPVVLGSPELLYSMYFRTDKNLLKVSREIFAPHLKAIDEFAKKEGRYEVEDIDRKRGN